MGDRQTQRDAMSDRVGYYVINMASSTDRWEAIEPKLAAAGIEAERVDAVDGRNTPPNEWQDFDIPEFRRVNGRAPRPGEYGCYMSHINAMQRFLDSGNHSAVILEDDANVVPGLPGYAEALDRRWHAANLLVRLCSHRLPAFEKLGDLDGESPVLGHSWFGPTGSASAYWISRAGAERLIETSLPAYCPYDIMQERSWETGVPFYQVKPNLLPIPSIPESTIVTSEAPEYRKFPPHRRLTTYAHRTLQFFQRLAICARTRSLPTGR